MSTEPSIPSNTIDCLPSDTIELKAYVRRWSATLKKPFVQKTNKEVPSKLRKSVTKMDPALFQMILQNQRKDIKSFQAERRNNPHNAQHAASWALFRAKHPKHYAACKAKNPKRRCKKPLTVENAKAIKASLLQAEYLKAIHDLSNPMPAKFQNFKG